MECKDLCNGVRLETLSFCSHFFPDLLSWFLVPYFAKISIICVIKLSVIIAISPFLTSGYLIYFRLITWGLFCSNLFDINHREIVWQLQLETVCYLYLVFNPCCQVKSFLDSSSGFLCSGHLFAILFLMFFLQRGNKIFNGMKMTFIFGADTWRSY